VLCHAVMCFAEPCHAVQCYAMLCCALLRSTVLCCAKPSCLCRCIVQCCLCCAVLCSAVLCCATLCCATLCCAFGGHSGKSIKLFVVIERCLRRCLSVVYTSSRRFKGNGPLWDDFGFLAGVICRASGGNNSLAFAFP
jgi:hypothetical protein